jgi:deazaflavin-dependent oxidoreductase (nitroreductase family)
MRKAYQHTRAMASGIAKWLILKQEHTFFIKSAEDPACGGEVSEAALDVCTFTKETPMAHTNFSSAVQNSNEIEITVTGRTSGRSLSYPVWFVLEGEKLSLLPVKGSDTDWYKNVRKTPTIRLAARGKTFTTSARLLTDEAKVGEVVKKFRDKYSAGTVNTLYSRLDAAVEVPLK